MDYGKTRQDEVVTDAMIDALVAGELRDEQYRQTVLALEAQPERWRDCALAFLVEQALQRDMQQLTQSNIDWRATVPNGASAGIERSGPRLPILESVKLDRYVRQHRQLEWMHRLTMIAALLLVSFTIGWFGAGMRGQATRPAQRDGDASETSVASQSQPPSLNQPQLTPSADGGQLQYVGQQIIPFERRLPPLLRKLQEESKIELESNSAFVPVFQDDSVILVPIHEYRVRPRAAY